MRVVCVGAADIHAEALLYLFLGCRLLLLSLLGIFFGQSSLVGLFLDDLGAHDVDLVLSQLVIVDDGDLLLESNYDLVLGDTSCRGRPLGGGTRGATLFGATARALIHSEA